MELTTELYCMSLIIYSESMFHQGVESPGIKHHVLLTTQSLAHLKLCSRLCNLEWRAVTKANYWGRRPPLRQHSQADKALYYGKWFETAQPALARVFLFYYFFLPLSLSNSLTLSLSFSFSLARSLACSFSLPPFTRFLPLSLRLLIRCLNLLQNNSEGREIKGCWIKYEQQAVNCGNAYHFIQM